MANVKEQRPRQQGRAQEHGKQVSEVGGGATALVKTSPAVPIVMNDPCLMYDEDLGRFAKLLAADMDKHVENANNEAKEYNRKLLTNWPVFVEIRSRFDNQGYRTDLIKEGNDADKEHKRTKQDLVRAFGATNHKEWVEKNFPWSVQYHNRRLKALKEASEFTQKLLEEQCDPNQSEDGGNNTGPVRGGVNPGTSHRTRKSDLIRYEHVSHVAFEQAKKYPGHPLANAIKAAALHHKFEPVSGTWRLPETVVDTQIAGLAVEMSEIANGQLGDKLMGNAAGKKLLSHAKQILAIKHQAKKITVKRPDQPLAGFGGTGNCESPSAAVPTGGKHSTSGVSGAAAKPSGADDAQSVKSRPEPLPPAPEPTAETFDEVDARFIEHRLAKSQPVKPELLAIYEAWKAKGRDVASELI